MSRQKKTIDEMAERMEAEESLKPQTADSTGAEAAGWGKETVKKEADMAGWEKGTVKKETEAAGWEKETVKKEADMAGAGQEREMEQRKNDSREEEIVGGRNKKAGKDGKKKRYATGSMAAKIIVFFMLIIFGMAGIASAFCCIYMGENGYYSSDLNTVLAREWSRERTSIMQSARSYLKEGNVDAAEELCRNRNIDLALIWPYGGNTESVLWTTWDGYNTEFVKDMGFDVYYSRDNKIMINGEELIAGRTYILRSYIDPDLSRQDYFQVTGKLAALGYRLRYMLIVVAMCFVLLCVCCFVFLMCSAGHRNGREGIVPGVFTALYLDILTVLYSGIVGALGIVLLRSCSDINNEGIQIAVLTAGGGLLGALSMAYFMDLARRFKLGYFWKHSLIYVAARGFWRIVCLIGRGLMFLMRRLPSMMLVIAVFGGICLFEFIGVLLFVRVREGILLWALEKAALFLLVMYLAVICKKLLEASRALVQGQEDYRVDTSGMLGDFKEHGENLNSLGQGISRAVAERMKSEHLKTELISNVSHDLKTPLTSIINYADLICEEADGLKVIQKREAGMQNDDNTVDALEKENREESGEASQETGSEALEIGTGTGDGISSEWKEQSGRNARIREYAEVLLRQSRRLKKLLEDLMEASKATTGNLEVNLEPCEAGVLLSQAVGEYQQKLEEKQLELIARQPEQSVKIVADGRHLWRVFDNLLNNICKYAQERSRVYLSVEQQEGCVQIIFRNMSKYALDISGEELEERFVRGDKSRHMEGNGLGLSIAKSLVELQNGKMEIVIDGDLFKVILRFAAYEQEK